jgi:NAD-dependent deacetylase
MTKDTYSERYARELEDLLRASERAVAFTGAGVSEESGIPTFRGQEGLWDRYPPYLYANLGGLALLFLARPSRVAAFASDVIASLLDAVPNPCHEVLAGWEAAGRIRGVITQNVDDLHAVAGSRNVCELHGNAFRVRCLRCGRKEKLPREHLREISWQLRRGRFSRMELLRLLFDYASRCRDCGGRRRPDVVLFGEGLPAEEWDRAFRWTSQADLFLVVGTSALVYPAAMLPRLARESGALVVEVNPEPTPVTALAGLHVPFPAGRFFSHFLIGKSHCSG